MKKIIISSLMIMTSSLLSAKDFSITNNKGTQVTVTMRNPDSEEVLSGPTVIADGATEQFHIDEEGYLDLELRWHDVGDMLIIYTESIIPDEGGNIIIQGGNIVLNPDEDVFLEGDFITQEGEEEQPGVEELILPPPHNHGGGPGPAPAA
jgi:hypothetical protein